MVPGYVTLDKCKLIFSRISGIPKSTEGSWQSYLVFGSPKYIVTSSDCLSKEGNGPLLTSAVFVSIRNQPTTEIPGLGTWVLYEENL